MKRSMRMVTERLILDPIRASDKEDYFINISHDRKVLETFICRYAESLEDFDFSAYLAPGQTGSRLFAIRLKETGRLIGILTCFDETEHSCEIGFGIGSRHWGHGYATEAVERFLTYLFDEKGFQTVYASFFPGNSASRRVMEKCGMHYDRFSEKELSYLGAERDLIYYRISRDSRRTLWAIRPLAAEETPAALRLAWKVFTEYESPDYAPEGTEEFRKCLHDDSYLTGIRYYGAFDGNRPVGVLGIREEERHICFFFVDGEYQRRGIGTGLFRRMREDFPAQAITLNSSPFGVPFYKALGFTATAPEQTVRGIRFTPMVYDEENQEGRQL